MYYSAEMEASNLVILCKNTNEKLRKKSKPINGHFLAVFR